MTDTATRSKTLLMLTMMLAGGLAACASQDGGDGGRSYGYAPAGDYYGGSDYWYYDRDGKRYRRGDRDHQGHDHDRDHDHDHNHDRDRDRAHDGKADGDRGGDRGGDRDGNREERRGDGDGNQRADDDGNASGSGSTLRQQENDRVGASRMGGYTAPPPIQTAPSAGGRGRGR